MKSICLDGDWLLTYSDCKDGAGGWGRWIRAEVPGDVHLALLDQGIIPEPLIADNNLKLQWIEKKYWWYRRYFFVEEVGVAVSEMVFDGLDLNAEIFLNGLRIGSAANMFHQHRFEVASSLRKGRNELLVRIEAGLLDVGERPIEKFAKSWGRQEPRRPWLRKAQQSFFWDTAPRLPTCGIWRGVRLESFEGLALRDAWVECSIEAHRASLNLKIEVENFKNCDHRCAAEWRVVSPSGRQHRIDAELEVGLGLHTSETAFDILDPELWWPSGYGSQPLYQISVILRCAHDGRELGGKAFKYGIRTLTIAQDQINERESEFAFIVNGLKIFAKGGNWVPSDSIYARIDEEKERSLIIAAKEANFNCLRVWGGGIYPHDHFFDACDEAGIMVWQDFMFACAYYPDDEDDFRRSVHAEAEQVVRRLRHHPSLALWCGNNEAYMMHGRVDPSGTFYGRRIYEETLPSIISRLDPSRYYHPSSPYPGPWPGQNARGDQHIWAPTLGWYEINKENPACDFSPEELKSVMDLWSYGSENVKFLSEYGVFCPSNIESVAKFLGEHPLAFTGAIYEHHRNMFESAGFINEMIRRYYPNADKDDPLEFTQAGQFIQAEAVAAITECQRSSFPRCGGVLFWEYNDSWGHVGYSPIDYFMSKKALYYYMKRAYAPVHIVIDQDKEKIHLCNETVYPLAGEIVYGFMDFNGKREIFGCLEASARPASVSTIVAGKAVKEKYGNCRNGLFFAEFKSETGASCRNRSFFLDFKELLLPKQEIHISNALIKAGSWNATVSSPSFQLMFRIDEQDGLSCSDNCFDLWPGEEKHIIIKTPEYWLPEDLRYRTMNAIQK